MVEKDVVIKEKLSLKNDYVFKRIFKKKANEELEYLSGNEEARRMAELKLKYKREMASIEK